MIQHMIGFLGAGNMAEALIRGLIETNKCGGSSLLASDINEIRLAHMSKTYGISTQPGNLALTEAAEVLLLAVKPQQVAEVLGEIRSGLDPQRHTLISIAAGIPTAFIEQQAQCPLKVVRVMPNTPARLKAGAAAFCLGQYAGEAEILLTHLLFETVGIVVQVKESLLNAVTALSGSGPAYIFKLCEMMTAAGLKMGLPADVADDLARQTILGAARMLTETGKSAEELRQAVTSPGGTTQAALEYLGNSDFEQVFQAALLAARDRAQSLMPIVKKGNGK
ncbi:pyrroline-5-carboxylate reductase [bacterium]|nr:pyrroline-5-carboxylate reductase [bacterium]